MTALSDRVTWLAGWHCLHCGYRAPCHEHPVRAPDCCENKLAIKAGTRKAHPSVQVERQA